jgi:hypothetical protein
MMPGEILPAHLFAIAFQASTAVAPAAAKCAQAQTWRILGSPPFLTRRVCRWSFYHAGA